LIEAVESGWIREFRASGRAALTDSGITERDGGRSEKNAALKVFTKLYSRLTRLYKEFDVWQTIAIAIRNTMHAVLARQKTWMRQCGEDSAGAIPEVSAGERA